MGSSYAFIHARMRSCKYISLACLRTCQSEGITHLFQKSPQVFQGEAHTLCEIDESNNNVGRATVFDTKKRRDEQVPIDVTADFHLASKVSSSNSGNFEHSNNYHHLFTQDLSLRHQMRGSVHHLNTNEKQQDLYFVIIIKMFDYFFIISYIL